MKRREMVKAREYLVARIPATGQVHHHQQNGSGLPRRHQRDEMMNGIRHRN
jgi:hypothetical protein